jgi:hypothetical protein
VVLDMGMGAHLTSGLVCAGVRLDAVAVLWVVWARRVMPLLFAAPTGSPAASPADHGGDLSQAMAFVVPRPGGEPR